MLERSHDGALLVVEVVPQHGAGRFARALVRAAAAGGGAVRRPVRLGRLGFGGSTAAGGEERACEPRSSRPASTAGAYLAAVAVAATAGTAARLSPRPLVAGVLAAITVGLAAHLVAITCRRYLASRRIALTRADSERVLDAAGDLAGRALAAAARLPDVSPVLGADDVRSTLETALWDLGRLLRSYERSREHLAAAERADRSIPRSNPFLRREFDRHRHEAAALVRQREYQIARRLADLRRLADAYDAFRRRREAADSHGDPRAVQELAARAESVLGAYRELLTWPATPPA